MASLEAAGLPRMLTTSTSPCQQKNESPVMLRTPWLMGVPSGSCCKPQHHPAGHRRLLLDLGHHHGANLRGVGHVRAAAGLKIDQRRVANPDRADAPATP